MVRKTCLGIKSDNPISAERMLSLDKVCLGDVVHHSKSSFQCLADISYGYLPISLFYTSTSEMENSNVSSDYYNFLLWQNDYEFFFFFFPVSIVSCLFYAVAISSLFLALLFTWCYQNYFILKVFSACHLFDVFIFAVLKNLENWNRGIC